MNNDSAGTRMVVDWIDYGEARDNTASIGGLGGWFDKGHRWSDYVATWPEDVQPYAEAIRTAVLEAGHPLTCGNQHQDDPDGVPLFDDGTVGVFSFRGWGDLMAAIATEKDGADHTYMEFYYA